MMCFLVLLVAVCTVSAVLFEEDRPPTYLSASVGEHAIFNCPLDFPHDIVVPYNLIWNRDGRTVFSWYGDTVTADEDYAGRVSLISSESQYGKGSVNLTSIRESDRGWYECVVFFPNRSPPTRRNGTWFHLDVKGDALLNTPPINQTTLEGGRAHFPCIIKNNSGAMVTWFKDGVELSSLEGMEGRYVVEDDGSLTIEPTDMTDPGEYLCVAQNLQGNKQTAGAFLDVQYKAKVIYSPRQVHLPYGRPGVLDCHFRANPPLTNLRWEKDGFLFDPYNVHGVFYRRNGSLYFSKVDETHEGQYTCTPINELGTQGASSPVTVIVQRPPIFTITPHNLYLRKIGDTLEMPCDAIDGSETHRPTIVWFRKDGSPLPVERMTMHNGNLTIDNLKESDRGLYQCVASNEAATITSDTELMIENVAPRAPYNVTATSDTSTVTLSWVPVFERPPLDYSVLYRLQGSSEWQSLRLVNSGITEATITGLNPGRTYELMVLSQDQHGDGMISKSILVQTKGVPEDNTSAQEYRSPLGK
ncbi:protein borderless isoform X2 [Anabrus simplex]|uniref:protein borderless isoform X2 n=1 Tax=Anabrus simplex TaxID=316456 RepID=UPI0035A3971A